MKRVKPNRHQGSPAALLTGDWHLREDVPVCRTDDFWATQWDKVRFIAGVAGRYKVPVIHSGDLFNHWKASPYLLSAAMENLPKLFYSVLGNHDLPQHNLELMNKSGMVTLVNSGHVELLERGHWGQSLTDYSWGRFAPARRVGVTHIMTYVGQSPWPGCVDPTAHALLKQYPELDLIVTGHNHKTFVVEQGGRLLVNPGSITRQSADQEDHSPCVFLWYPESNTVEEIPIPHPVGAVSRRHLEDKEERNGRIDAFIAGLDKDSAESLSFEDTVARMVEGEGIRTSVKNLVYKALEALP